MTKCNIMNTRRNFIRTAALGAAASVMAPAIGKGYPALAKGSSSRASAAPYKIGVAGFTFAHFNIDQSIAMMNRIGVADLSLKDFHLPLNSTPEKISEVLGRFKAGGINIYAVGVIYMTSKDAIDKAFDYTRKVGVPLMIGVPAPDLIDYTEQKVKEYDIWIAIHNHGPEDKLYPHPKMVYDLIKDRDKRMGLCLDIGHSQRAGADPVTMVKQYGHRIYDMHIKDVTAAQRDGKAIEIGRGMINFPGLVKELYKQKYNGHCSIEFEKDMTDPLPGIAESIGYFKGVTAATA